MIVRTVAEAAQGDRRVVGKNWESIRLILSADAVGFSFHISTMHAGTETHLWYKNHFEAVYCIEGEGEVEVVPTGEIYPIRPGTVYVLNQHDRHILRAATRMTNACVFTPALHGRESHDSDGSYPLAAEAARGRDGNAGPRLS